MFNFKGICFASPHETPWRFDTASDVSGNVNAMGRFSAGEMNLQLKNTKTNETLIVLGAAGHDLTAICFAKKIINNAMDLFEIRAMGLWAGVIAGSIVGLSAEGCVYGVTAQ